MTRANSPGAVFSFAYDSRSSLSIGRNLFLRGMVSEWGNGRVNNNGHECLDSDPVFAFVPSISEILHLTSAYGTIPPPLTGPDVW